MLLFGLASRFATSHALSPNWTLIPVSYTHLDVYKRQVFVVMFAVFLHNLILKQQVDRRTERLRQTMKEKLTEHQAAVKANRHLHDMEKINLVGMLSSMIAHELRQPLTAIRNYSEGINDIIRSQDYDVKVVEEGLRVIDDQSIRASMIIEHMRSLIKGCLLYTSRCV